MNDAVTETKFSIEDVGILERGKVVLVGFHCWHPLKPGMRAVLTTAAEELSVDVVSIGIADPPPENPDRELLQVRVSGGNPRSSSFKPST